eukprot:6196366-Pleurochrysis_carterae.AAC.1
MVQGLGESDARIVRTPPLSNRGGKEHRVEHHHTPPRVERGKGLPAKFKLSARTRMATPTVFDWLAPWAVSLTDSYFLVRPPRPLTWKDVGASSLPSDTQGGLPLPLSLSKASRPNGRRSEYGDRTFCRYGPLSFRAPRRAGHLQLRRAQRGYRLCLYFFVRTRPTSSLSHPLMNSNYVPTAGVGAGSAFRNRCSFGELTIYSAG